MVVQAIAQGTCTACQKRDENWMQQDRTMDEDGITALLSCKCGESKAVVRIDAEKLTTRGRISHEDATWNEEEE